MSITPGALAYLRPIDIVYTQWDFKALDNAQLTVADGELLLLLSTTLKEGWAAVRKCSPPPAGGAAASGLVPQAFLKSGNPQSRAYAIYTYSEPPTSQCIRMYLGRKMDVIGIVKDWALVRVDGWRSQPNGAIGYVPRTYIKFFEESNVAEVRGPSALQQLPERSCSFCEDSVVNKFHFECSQCHLPNGDPLLICRSCSYRRQACLVHQANKGQNHLFDIKRPRNSCSYCDGCRRAIQSEDYFSCLACRSFTSKDFDLCTSCFGAPKQSHEHSMTKVTQADRITESHVTALPIPKISPLGIYTCNGCTRDVVGYILHCRVCPAGGFDICPECAEIDRATYLHDRWTRGGPHDFEIKWSSKNYFSI